MGFSFSLVIVSLPPHQPFSHFQLGLVVSLLFFIPLFSLMQSRMPIRIPMLIATPGFSHFSVIFGRVFFCFFFEFLSFSYVYFCVPV